MRGIARGAYHVGWRRYESRSEGVQRFRARGIMRGSTLLHKTYYALHHARHADQNRAYPSNRTVFYRTVRCKGVKHLLRIPPKAPHGGASDHHKIRPGMFHGASGRTIGAIRIREYGQWIGCEAGSHLVPLRYLANRRKSALLSRSSVSWHLSSRARR